MQLDLFAGKQKRDEGIKQRLNNENGFVISLLRSYAIEYSKSNGSVSSDELRAYAERENLPITHPNSWGGITASIFKGEQWQEIGRKQSAIVGNHARKISVFRYRG